MLKNFKEVSRETFIEVVNKYKNDITLRDQYDTNPPLILYMLNKMGSASRIAYIENNDKAYNGKPNRYFVLKDA